MNDKLNGGSINNVDNANYQPIFSAPGDGMRVFNYLYGSVGDYKEMNDSENAKDEALRIKFDTTGTNCNNDSAGNETCYANRNFSTMDFSQHKEFRFLLHGAGSGATGTQFYLKVGTQQNYDKVIVPVDYDGWHLISLKMVDTNGDGIADTFRNVSDASYRVEVSSKRTNHGQVNFCIVAHNRDTMLQGDIHLRVG